jgi:hypothetical protein
MTLLAILALLLVTFVAIVILRDLGPPLWSAIQSGRMAGVGRPYTREETPFRFFFAIGIGAGTIICLTSLTCFVLFATTRQSFG